LRLFKVGLDSARMGCNRCIRLARELVSHERQAPPNGRLMNWHCHRNNLYYLGGVDGHAAEMGGCMLPGHRALYYYLWNAGKEALGERCLHGTAGVCHMYLWTKTRNLQSQYRWFYGSGITICDPWRSGCRIAIHDTRSENCNITNTYIYKFMHTYIQHTSYTHNSICYQPVCVNTG